MMMFTGGHPATRAVLLGVLGACLATGCDKAQLLAPSNSTIALSASAVVVAGTGTASLSAVVTESSGTVVQNGTTVRFTTTLGRVEPAEVQTRNGAATATFYADGSSGVAMIVATSGAATGGSGSTATNTVSITVGAAAVDTVTLQASPASVPASGGTVTITASVVGANNSVLGGVPVAFSSTGGVLSATQVTTDAGGNASVQLTTNREVTVTAIVGSKPATVIVKVATPATVTLTPPTTNARAGTPMALVVTPEAGTAPTVVISWGDGASSSLGLVQAARTVTHVYAEPGTYTVSAEARDGAEVFMTSAVVQIDPREPPKLDVDAPSGTTAKNFVFTVTPATSSGVSDVSLDFGDGQSVDLGAIASPTTVSHTYALPGTYTARAEQTDASGGKSAAVKIVTVTAVVVTP